MSVVRALAVLAACLALEVLLARLAPVAHGSVDVMLVPVAWYGLSRSQRAAMGTGCAAGLLHDTWFQAGAFGMNGFKKTLLGWILGGLATRLDLDHAPGRLAVGAGLSVADQLLELGLSRLLDLNPASVGPVRFVVKAILTGLLVAATFPVVEWVRSRGAFRRPVRRKG